MCFNTGSRHLGCWGQNTSRIQNKVVYATLYLQAGGRPIACGRAADGVLGLEGDRDIPRFIELPLPFEQTPQIVQVAVRAGPADAHARRLMFPTICFPLSVSCCSVPYKHMAFKYIIICGPHIAAVVQVAASDDCTWLVYADFAPLYAQCCDLS